MLARSLSSFLLFCFNDTATTEIYTLSLHDALPIYPRRTCLRIPTGSAVHVPWQGHATFRGGGPTCAPEPETRRTDSPTGSRDGGAPPARARGRRCTPNRSGPRWRGRG